MKKGLYYEKSNVKGMGCLYYYFGQSSNVEKIGERGLSHYAEHLICKSFDHLLPKIKALGISYNAATYDNFVIFYWHGLDDNLKMLEPELKNILLFTPTKEQFESERNIILQEYAENFSDQGAIWDNIKRKYFNYYSPIGAKSDIENVTYEKMLKFLERFKNPTSIIRITNNSKKNVKAMYSDVKFKNEMKHANPGKTEFVQEGDSTFPKSGMMAEWLDITNKIDEYELNFLSTMLSSGLDTPFYQEIREKRGLCYSLSSHCTEFQGKSLWYFIDNTTSENVSEIQNVVYDMLKNPEVYITRDLFDYTLESQKNSIIKTNILNYQFGNIIQIIEEHKAEKVINTITYERILEIANMLKNEIPNIHSASYGETMNF